MSWYVVNTKSRQEEIAELSLRRLGVEIFSPQIKENRVLRRKKRVVTGPLFPGYFFARFDMNTHYKAVHYAHGVRRLVTYGSVPAVVDEEDILSIKSKIEEDFVVIPPPCFESGQVVRIQEGPFEGLEAVFERALPAQQRVVLLLKMLSYHASVVVDREAVTTV